MSSLQGLPPLPRSLSGFNLSGGRGESGEPPPPPTRSSSKSQRGGKTPLQSASSRPSQPTRQLTTLDTQLAVLRREMVRTEDRFHPSSVSLFCDRYIKIDTDHLTRGDNRNSLKLQKHLIICTLRHVQQRHSAKLPMLFKLMPEMVHPITATINSNRNH